MHFVGWGDIVNTSFRSFMKDKGGDTVDCKDKLKRLWGVRESQAYSQPARGADPLILMPPSPRWLRAERK